MVRALGWAAFSGVLRGLTLLTKFTWLFLVGLWPLCWFVVRALVCSPGFSRILLVTPATMPPEGGTIRHAVMSERIGERHASACRYKKAMYRRAHATPLAGLISGGPEYANTLLTDPTEISTLRLTAPKRRWRDDLGHMSLILLSAFWVLNNGYLFEDTFKPLGSFAFSSKALAGEAPDRNVGEPGNRFRGTLLEHLPVPVPRNFLQGIDHIKFEYEMGVNTADDAVSRTMRFSSVFSVTSVVKSAIRRFCDWFQSGKNRTRRADAQPLAGEVWAQWFETLYLLAPAIGILWLVSSQTGFNHHLRYVLPAFPFLFIFASRTALLLNSRWRLVRLLPVVCVLGTIISSLSVYPHCLSYFNELSGGSINGWKHLDYSNIGYSMRIYHVKPSDGYFAMCPSPQSLTMTNSESQLRARKRFSKMIFRGARSRRRFRSKKGT